MPGYKQHMVGGAIAYGLTLAAVLTLSAHIISQLQRYPISLFPVLMQQLCVYFGAYMPTMVCQLSKELTRPTIIFTEWLMCAFFGSLFPDLDIKSKGQILFYRTLVLCMVGLFFCNYRYIPLLPSIALLLPMVVHHRGVMHRWWFLVAISIGFWLMISISFPSLQHAIFFDLLFFNAGAFSHLWLDLGFKRMMRF